MCSMCDMCSDIWWGSPSSFQLQASRHILDALGESHLIPIETQQVCNHDTGNIVDSIFPEPTLLSSPCLKQSPLS